MNQVCWPKNYVVKQHHIFAMALYWGRLISNQHKVIKKNSNTEAGCGSLYTTEKEVISPLTLLMI